MLGKVKIISKDTINMKYTGSGGMGGWKEIKSHTCEEGGAYLTNFLLALMNFEKPKKSEFRKNEKSTRRCHRFKLVQQKTQSNDICLLRVQSATDPVFCHFGPIFALLPQYWPQKLPADTILLHMCAINQDHIMYGSWDIKYKGQSFLSFCAIFCPLSLLTTPKIKILKKTNAW